MGDQPAGYQLDKFSAWRKKERMADWDDIVNNRITMGHVRLLCYALNEVRRRREEGIEEWRPGVNPFLGRKIRPVIPRFFHWERVPGHSNNVNMA